MKEITYEDWQKNPTPRVMWVWNEDEKLKVKRKVIYVLRDDHARVITIDDDDSDYEPCKHCAEIETQRRMTNKELSRWLRENTTREYKWINKNYSHSDYVYSSHVYLERCADEEVDSSIVIREDDSEWREPTIEV